MSRYIDYSDVIGRYPKATDVGSASNVESTYIRYSEAWADGALSAAFTAPFSDNNLTVKDLCIDHTYMKIIEFKDTKKSNSIQKSLDARVKALLEGSSQMTLEDGTVLGQNVASAWSEAQEHSPTFGIGGTDYAAVSSSRLYEEEQARD